MFLLCLAWVCGVSLHLFFQELLKVLYVDPTLTFLKDVNYNPGRFHQTAHVFIWFLKEFYYFSYI